MRLQERTIAEQRDINGYSFPLVLAPDTGSETSREGLLDWLSTHRDDLKQKLMQHGAVLLRDCPVRSPQDFELVLDAAKFVNMPYVGGAAPREQVIQGRILTANESPPDEPIPFHHEMAQVPNPPAYIFFYCDIASETGGETAIVHSHTVYQRFASLNPDFAKRVEELGVKYVRIMPEEDDPSSPIGRSWKSTFQATNRSDAEARMKEIGTRWAWNPDGTLHTETAVVPAIRYDDRTGMKTFFNSMVAAYMGWVDARNDPKKAVVCGDDSPVDGDALLKTSQAMDEECVAFRWEKGDVLLIDNRLVMHSRRPYTGSRRILASIAVG